MTYADKLKDPRWQKRRLEILQRDDFTCQECNTTEKSLNVHHLRYRSGADPWDYPDEWLRTLCEDCHRARHTLAGHIADDINALDLDDMERIAGYVLALAESKREDGTAVFLPSAFIAQGFVDAVGIGWEECAALTHENRLDPYTLPVGAWPIVKQSLQGGDLL